MYAELCESAYDIYDGTLNLEYVVSFRITMRVFGSLRGLKLEVFVYSL